MEIKGYTLVNESKAKRAYDKELGAGKGATDEEVLTLYAKFGGLIKEKGVVVDNGKFWDFAGKKAVKQEVAKTKGKKEKEVKEEKIIKEEVVKEVKEVVKKKTK